MASFSTRQQRDGFLAQNECKLYFEEEDGFRQIASVYFRLSKHNFFLFIGALGRGCE